jgi:hypothetical protein
MTETSGIITTTVAGFTDVGMVRTNNEDNYLIADLKTGRVFLIPQRIGTNWRITGFFSPSLMEWAGPTPAR